MREKIEELIEHYKDADGAEYVVKHLTAALSFVPDEAEETVDTTSINDEPVSYEWVTVDEKAKD